MDSIYDRWCEENNEETQVDDQTQLPDIANDYDPLKDETNMSAIQSLNSHHTEDQFDDLKDKHQIKEEEPDLIKPKKSKKADVKKISSISNKDMMDDD